MTTSHGASPTFISEIKRLQSAQVELIAAMKEAKETGDEQFASAIRSHWRVIEQELGRLLAER